MGRAVKFFGYDERGEPRVYTHSIDRDNQRIFGMVKHGAWYLRCFGRHYHVEWNLFGRFCSVSLSFADIAIGGHAVQFHLGIPFVISFWLIDESACWPQRLPGVRWRSYSEGGYASGEREFSLRFHSGALWWSVWGHCDKHWGTWRYNNLNFVNLLFGRSRFEEVELQSSEDQILESPQFITMPEGRYPATWKRVRRIFAWPRWFRSVEQESYQIEVDGGVPVPGKGENGWDCGDDATWGMSFPADDIDGYRKALDRFADRVMATRRRYASLDWTPSNGWPSHCDRSWYGIQEASVGD